MHRFLDGIVFDRVTGVVELDTENSSGRQLDVLGAAARSAQMPGIQHDPTVRAVCGVDDLQRIQDRPDRSKGDEFEMNLKLVDCCALAEPRKAFDQFVLGGGAFALPPNQYYPPNSDSPRKFKTEFLLGSPLVILHSNGVLFS